MKSLEHSTYPVSDLSWFLSSENNDSSFYVTSSYRCSETNQFDVSTTHGNGNCRYINGIHKPGKAITY